MFWQRPSQPFVPSEYNAFLASFSQADVDQIVQASNVMSVVVVRHPMSRVVSAWAQKFRAKGEFDQHRDEWLLKWPKLADFLTTSTTTSHRISFQNFLQFFLESSTPSKFNPHWNLASDACQVCHRPYNWVVKEETIDSDLLFLTHKFNLTLPQSFFKTMKGKSASSNTR